MRTGNDPVLVTVERQTAPCQVRSTFTCDSGCPSGPVTRHGADANDRCPSVSDSWIVAKPASGVAAAIRRRSRRVITITLDVSACLV